MRDVARCCEKHLCCLCEMWDDDRVVGKGKHIRLDMLGTAMGDMDTRNDLFSTMAIAWHTRSLYCHGS